MQHPHLFHSFNSVGVLMHRLQQKNNKIHLSKVEPGSSLTTAQIAATQRNLIQHNLLIKYMQTRIPGGWFYKMKSVILLSNLSSLSIAERYIMSFGIISLCAVFWRMLSLRTH